MRSSISRLVAILGFLVLLFINCRGEKFVFTEMPLGIDRDTELTADSGKREKLLNAFRPVTLLFFGFTRCPDFCPLTLHKIDSAITGISQLQEKIRLLFVSVDYEHEKPDDLRNFLKPFSYARGYLGSQKEINRLEKALGAYSKSEAGKLSHSLYVYVLNANGKVIYLLRHDDPVEKIRKVIEQAAEIKE